MHKNIPKIAALSYGVTLGLVGLHDYYLGKTRHGIIHTILFALTILAAWGLFPLKLALTRTVLIDNVYIPFLDGANLALYKFVFFITFALIIGNVIWTILELWQINAHSSIKVKPASTKRYVLLSIFLGITGVHDIVKERYKYGLLHIAFLILGIIFIIIKLVGVTFYANIALYVGIALLDADYLLAIAEAIGAACYNKSK